MGTTLLYRSGLAVVLMASMTGAQTGIITPKYTAPDIKSDIFGGQLTVKAEERQQAATALAGLVRNDLSFKLRKDYDTAARLLGIALRLDPENREALIVSGQLEDGQTPTHAAVWLREAPLKQIHTLAETCKASKSKPDRMLAAYLYSAVVLVAPNDEDTYQVQLLKGAGVAVNWTWANGKDTEVRPTHTDSRALTVRSVTKIKGLVVLRGPDGLWHGKVLEIIAVPAAAGTSPTPMAAPAPPPSTPSSPSGTSRTPSGTSRTRTMPTRMIPPYSPNGSVKLIGVAVGEMTTSLDEAVRLVTAKHTGMSRTPIEISFDDKYSQKDGGSAGAAFTLLMLSAVGDFELADDAAMTGDITVDEKVRPVGGVAAKVHGATLDGCKLVAIPASNDNQLEDAILLQGQSALWETQILSVETVKDAIAVMRKDRDEKLMEAISLFAELKKEFSTKQPAALFNNAAGKEKLAKIIELAPNHVSATYLQKMATGWKPKRLTLSTTITEGLAALGAMGNGLRETTLKADYVTDSALATAKRNIEKVRRIGDPAANPFLSALDAYATSYAQWATATARRETLSNARRLRDDVTAKRGAVQASIETLVADRDTVDKLLRE